MTHSNKIQPDVDRKALQVDTIGMASVIDRVRQVDGTELFEITEDQTESGHHGLFISVPEGRSIESIKPLLDEYRAQPERRVGAAQVRTLDSFLAHVKYFTPAPVPNVALTHSVIFADPTPTAPKFTAVYDYHPPTRDITEARFGEHRCVYTCPLSEPWKAWAKINGQWMEQSAFAQTIEDRIGDVVLRTDEQLDADIVQLIELLGARLGGPSSLMSLSRGLEVNVNANVKQALTLTTGEVTVAYQETHSDGTGAPIRTPNLFILGLPVFEGGEAVLLPVRLRYRQRNNKLEWSFHLHRADRVFDVAFAQLQTAIAAGTSLPLFVGAPEA